MAPGRILLVEDDESGRELASYNLRRAGYEVEAAGNGQQGLVLFDPERHDVVVTDLKMPEMDGLAVLRAVKARAAEVPVLVITAYGSVDTAVEAMKAGAYDFIGKPFQRDHLLLVVRRALESRQLRQEVQRLRAQARGVEREIISASEPMRRVLEIADRVAASQATVLITGETGTGKELVARRIHARSARAEGPFVALSCAAIPPELIESELFGHERGAFTGAARPRVGRFRQAQGGTLFLDEIAELPIALQSKLLRVLQERVVDVVGADEPVAVDVRVVTATNQDLAARAHAGEFREDLLYRLDVVEVSIPPLRERPEDIEPLVRHFAAQFSGDREVGVSDSLLAEMRARPWPGNVRQLQNACERLVILCPGSELRIDDLPAADPHARTDAVADAAEPPVDGDATPLQSGEWPPLPAGGLGLVDLERRVIERVLALKQGNVSQAAAYLRVPRHILAYRMGKYGIRRPG